MKQKGKQLVKEMTSAFENMYLVVFYEFMTCVGGCHMLTILMLVVQILTLGF